MPIRILRDPLPEPRPPGEPEPSPIDQPEPSPIDQPDPPPIVVTGQAGPGARAEPAETTRTAERTEGLPAQTTWTLASCQCTMTGGSYVLAFRKEGDTYVLKSIDRSAGPETSTGIDNVYGPFNWAAFACPECGRAWSSDGGEEAVFPVIRCSCRSLFCTRKGVERRKGPAGEEWWWHCPKCGIESHIKIGLRSLHAQALKGK